MVNSAIKFVNSKSNLRLGGARMMGTPRALSKLLRPPPKNCLPGHLCLKTMLSTSGQPLRRRCLPKQNCSRTWIYHRPLATPLNFGTITGNNSSCSTKYLARFCAHQPVKRLLSISGHTLSQRRLRTTDKNFENVLFANVNYNVFDAELRKRKQPDSDDNNQ